MQIFEVLELKEFPFMETKEIVEGTTVGDIINNESDNKAFLLIDHDTKRIWTYNEPLCPLKIQIYGGILAGMLRQQLKLFYRVYPLNMYSTIDKEFQEILDKQLGAGRAKSIEKTDFTKPTSDKNIVDLKIESPNYKKAIEYLSQFPKPKNLLRRFMIIGAQIFTDEEFIESFLKEEKTVTKHVKLGQLNNGFTFFKDQNYSTRLIIKDRKIQGIELYVNKDERSPSLELQIPVISEEKFKKPGSVKSLIDAFQIPDEILEETEGHNEKTNRLQNDSTNQS